MNEYQTRQITVAIASGDTGAFARFYEEWFGFMFGCVRKATGMCEDDCLDVVQDAMMRVIRSIPVLDSERALRAWVRRVALTTAYDALRKDSRRRRRELAHAERTDAGKDLVDADSPEERRERLEWLRSELDGLSEQQRTLIEGKHRAGEPLRTIGARLGIGPGAADGRISRLMRSLRKRAKEVFDEV